MPNRKADSLLSIPPWSSCIPRYSHTIFVRCPHSTARARLAARHLEAGIVQTLEEADRRAVENDLTNGDEVLRLLREEDVHDFVDSVEHGGWASPSSEE
jgi:pantothenate kinase